MQKNRIIPSKTGKKRLTIGFLCAFRGHGGVTMELSSGVQDAARKHDINLVSFFEYSVYSFFSNNVSMEWGQFFRFINSNNLDGLITWSSTLKQYLGITNIEEFHRQFLPLPMVNLGMQFESIPSILVDDREGIQTIMKHLVEVHGYKKIAFAQGLKGHYAFNERYLTYLAQLKAYNLPFKPELVTDASDEETNLVETVSILFDERKLLPQTDIEAIVTPSDLVTEKIILDLEKRGLDVPEDIAVTGFNNSSQSRSSSPTFTTVDPDFYNHGYRAVEALLTLIRGGTIPNRILMPNELVIRQSCGCFESAINKAEVTGRLGSDINKEYDEDLLQQALAECKPVIVEEFTNLTANYHTDLPFKCIDDLFYAFARDLIEEQSNHFLNTINNYLKNTKDLETNMAIWQDIISIFRRHLLGVIRKPDDLRKVETIWHKARVLIYLKTEYSPDSFALEYKKKSSRLTEIGGLFISTALDLDKLATVLEKELPQLDISGCYLCLFETITGTDTDTVTDTVTVSTEAEASKNKEITRLVMGLDTAGKIDPGSKPTICSRESILPEGIHSTDKRYSLLVKSCNYNENKLGYVVFKIDRLDSVIYEYLRVNFSGVLQVALILKERIKAERERAALFRALEQKNKELEQNSISMKQINTQLEAAILAANRANSAKSIFLANMSHEIRTPMNSVMGFIELLSRTKLNNNQLDYISVLKKSTQNLLGIINDVLDLSKIESGNVRIEMLEFNPLLEFELVSELFTVRANEKKIELLSFITPELPAGIKGDALRIKQVLMNLLSNAIKFTEQGGMVILEITLQNIKETSCRINFSITDTGVGIKKELQKNIFKPFEQPDNSITKKYGGTGLGLAISTNLVNLMGSKLCLISAEGKGSQFYFDLELPITRISYESQTKYKTITCRIGFYQPSVTSNYQTGFVKRYLASLQQPVKIFSSKEELSALQISPEPLDILIFVYSAGSEETIIDLRTAIPSPPGILIASVLDKERVSKYNTLFTNVIYQPVTSSRLFDTIVGILFGKKGFVTQINEDLKLTNSKVLVAEDNETNQQLIKILLNEMGVTVDLADDGYEAIDLFKKQKYDLVLMDGNMPRCDGMEAAAKIIAIEKKEKRQHTPIVALTARAIRGDRDSFLRAGMDEYLSKPIQVNELKRILKKFITGEQRKEAAPGSADVIIKQEEKRITANPEAAPEIAFDITGAARDLGLGVERYMMLAENFLAKAGSAMRNMYMLVQNNDYTNLYNESHKLKGVALNLRFTKAAELLLEIEKEAQMCKQLDYSSMLSAVEREFACLKKIIL